MIVKIGIVLVLNFVYGPLSSSAGPGCPIRFIFPGTNWCGDGDRARNYDDLGYHRNTDKCCRAHDKCPMNIPGLTEKYGLDNKDPFTRSHCDCDRDFYDCLMADATPVSRFITKLYFHVIPDQCFVEKKDEREPSGEPVYEWVDTTKFLNLKEELYGICELNIPKAIAELSSLSK